MKNLLRDFFLNKISMVACAMLSLIFWILWGFYSFKFGIYELLFDSILYVLLIIGLLISYKKGETNIQKALLGSIFLLMLNSSIEIFYANLSSGDKFLNIINLITMVLTFVIAICHLFLQSDHIGNSGAMITNQLCGFMILALLVYFLRQTFFVSQVSILDVTFLPAWAFTYLILICVETRIQVYKKERFEAKKSGNWNDDTRKQAKKIFDFSI